MENYKLPKQWKHWCDKIGLQSHGRKSRKEYDYCYLKGRGRYWRVNMYGEFEASESYETFDRWANSIEKTFDALPTCYNQFKSMVESV